VQRRSTVWLVLIALAALLPFARPVLAEPTDGPATDAAQEAEAPAPAAPADDAPSPDGDAADAPATKGLPTLGTDGGTGQQVVILPINGTIDMGLAPFVRRVLEENPDAAAIVLDVDTFGGRVDAAVQIRDALLGAEPPVIAYVHPRAISAGALISYAADHIVFAPGGSMGAVTPVQQNDEGGMEAVDEKMTSYMRAEMRTTAEANGRDGDLAEAMVDRTLVVDGVVDDTKLLTATTELAVELGLADDVQETLGDVLAAAGLEKAEQVQAETYWAEELSRFLTDPAVSGILMSLGMLGLLIELYSPGVGLPGAVGVLCLAAFFGGHLIADLAGMEELVLLALGLVALGLEVFVIPGFGVAGVLGIVFILSALSLSLVGMPLTVSWELGYLTDALQTVLVSVAATIVIMGLIVRFLPRRAMPNWLVLRTELGKEGTAPAAEDADFHTAPDQAELVGKEGVAETDLRLSGKARIDGQVVDVVSAHAYLRRGVRVRVTAVEGPRVVVEEIAEEGGPAEAPA
jgi:membrane-bound serine protease (ClpP class)